MIRLIHFLWSGCWHKWSVFRSVPFDKTWDGELLQRCTLYTLRCEKCGRMKKWKSL